MKTWKSKEGVWVSEKPRHYLIGVDKHGEEVFTGDMLICRSPYAYYNGLRKADEDTGKWTLSYSYLKKY